MSRCIRSVVHKRIASVFLSTQIICFIGNNEKKNIIWASTRENLSSGFANNNGTDKPAHEGRLISAFVIRFLERFFLSKLATCAISIF